MGRHIVWPEGSPDTVDGRLADLRDSLCRECVLCVDPFGAAYSVFWGDVAWNLCAMTFAVVEGLRCATWRGMVCYGVV